MRAFLETYAPLIMRLARGQSGGVVDAGDLANDVATSLIDLHRRGKFDPATIDVPEGYLRVVVRHAASRARRKHAREHLADDGDVEALAERGGETPSPEELTRDAIDKRRWLDKVKSKLRPRDAAAFALLVEDGLSIEEVAAALGSTANNVYQMRHRILAAAKEMLDDGKEIETTDLPPKGDS